MSLKQNDTYIEDLVEQHAQAVFRGDKPMKKYIQQALEDAGHPLEEGDNTPDCAFDHREEYIGYETA